MQSMMTDPGALIAFTVVSCFIVGALYAVIYRVTSNFLTGTKATWRSSYFAGVAGYAALLVIFVGGVFLLSQMPEPSRYVGAAVILGGLATQALVTGLLLRGAEGKAVGFLNGIKLIALPTLLFFIYWYATRPEYLR